MTEPKIGGYPAYLIATFEGEAEYLEDVVYQGDEETMRKEFEHIKEARHFYQDELWETMVLYKAVAVKQIQPSKTQVKSEVLE